MVKSNHKQLFPKVLKRYEDTVVGFKLNGSNMKIPLDDGSIDGVITSPSYSFAIDYVKNDEAQLNFLGYDIDNIRSNMIGLIDKNKVERLKNYFNDMESVCSSVKSVEK